MGVGCRVMWPTLLTVRWPGLGSLSLSCSTVAAPPARAAVRSRSGPGSVHRAAANTNKRRAAASDRPGPTRPQQLSTIHCRPAIHRRGAALPPPPPGQPGLTSDPRRSPSPAGRRTRTESRSISLGLEPGGRSGGLEHSRPACDLVSGLSVVCDLVCGLWTVSVVCDGLF